MKTTGSVQEKNGRFYFVVNLYDANGKRKIKWISTGLTVRGNKRKAESMLREVLLHYDETGELPTGRGGTYEKVDAKPSNPSTSRRCCFWTISTSGCKSTRHPSSLQPLSATIG